MNSPAGPPRDGMPEWVGVGRILGAHGVRGEFAVEVESDTLGRFDRGATVFLDRAPIEIEASRRHKGLRLLCIKGVEDRDQAQALKGRALEVPRSEVPSAPEGEYYYYELIGCEFTDELEGPLGRIVDVIEDGGGLLLEIHLAKESGAEQSLLVPFVQAHLVNVDIQKGEIRSRLPPGLVELCASTS